MKYKKIYFVGIKGVGMTSLALIAKEASIEIRGSDIEKEFITDDTLRENNVQICTEFSREDLAGFIGDTPPEEILLVTTSAHGGFDNPQVDEAKQRGIRILTHGQAVGEFMKGEMFGRVFRGISVSGSHGKTTISGMLATVLVALGQDPSFTVGTSSIFPIGNPGHFGNGDLFIAEADEYVSEIQYDRKPKLLYQFPEIIIVNNIDFDHPDFYSSVEEIQNVFLSFMNQVPQDGIIIVNGDDSRIEAILQGVQGRRIIRCGISDKNDYALGDYHEKGRTISFKVHKKSGTTQEYNLNIPGVHNTLNALTVIALCEALGYPGDDVARALEKFEGTKRRFEIVGKMKNDALIIDDYAHHPEEITQTLSALRLAYPDKKIVCIFQPHTLSRTEALLTEFAESFAGVQSIILLPVFITQRENDASREEIDVLTAFQKINEGAVLLKDHPSVVEYVLNHTSPDSIVITMGAGDVYLIGKELKSL